MLRRSLLGGAASLMLGPAAAASDVFPQRRPIRLVLPYPPGGGGHALALFLAEHLGERLGQPVLVENRPGATSTLGAAEVARAVPDGHTLLLNTTGFLVHLPHQKRTLPYDPWADFTPITPLMEVGLVLTAHPAVSARDVAGLVAYARPRPGQVAYGSWGIGGASHFYFAMLEQRSGIVLNHVPYKGLAEIHRDLLENRVQLTFDATPQGQEYVRRGRLSALAVTGTARVPGLPDVPTFADQGFAGFEWARGMGLFGPGGLPRHVAQRLHQEVAAIVATAQAQRFMAGMGFVPGTMAPEHYAQQLRDDARHWAPILKALGIRLD